MPRQPRFFVPGYPLHLVQRGNNRQPVFVDDEDRNAYLSFLRVAAKHCVVSVHAYVLMTNHVHILATPSGADAIPAMMQKAVRNYAVRFNARHERTGSLWEGRYRGTIVDSDAYLFACMRYIELNPVRAGLCSRPEDYAWSSHVENARSSTVPWIEPHDLYLALAGARTDSAGPTGRCSTNRLAARCSSGFGTPPDMNGHSANDRSDRPSKLRARGEASESCCIPTGAASSASSTRDDAGNRLWYYADQSPIKVGSRTQYRVVPVVPETTPVTVAGDRLW